MVPTNDCEVHRNWFQLDFQAGISFIFYGLKLMTEELEKPMDKSSQGFDLYTIFRSMFAL